MKSRKRKRKICEYPKDPERRANQDGRVNLSPRDANSYLLTTPPITLKQRQNVSVASPSYVHLQTVNPPQLAVSELRMHKALLLRRVVDEVNDATSLCLLRSSLNKSSSLLISAPEGIKESRRFYRFKDCGQTSWRVA